MSLFSQKEYKYIFSGFLSQGKCLEEGFLCLLVDKVIKIIESSSFKLLIELDMKKNLQVQQGWKRMKTSFPRTKNTKDSFLNHC